MVGYGRVVDVLPAYSEQRAFQQSRIHTISRPFFLTLWYNNIWVNNRETCSPRILKHCGAITGALNIRAQHDAAHRFPWLCAPAARPFLHYASHLAEVNSRSSSAGRRRSQNGPHELPWASSKTQYGGLKLREYHMVVEARGGGHRGQEKIEGLDERIEEKGRKTISKVEIELPLLQSNCDNQMSC